MRALFDWDTGNLAKCKQHGVAIEEIEALFRADPFLGGDERHSEDEERYIAIGPNSAGRALFVAFTLRTVAGEERIRPISARYMHQKELSRYERKWREEDPGSAH